MGNTERKIVSHYLHGDALREDRGQLIEKTLRRKISVAHPAIFIVLTDPSVKPPFQMQRPDRAGYRIHPLLVLDRNSIELSDIVGDCNRDAVDE